MSHDDFFLLVVTNLITKLQVICQCKSQLSSDFSYEYYKNIG